MGNKSDMDESKRAVPYSRGQALADEFRLQFFETSAKNNTNVEEVFQASVFCTGCLAGWPKGRPRSEGCVHVSSVFCDLAWSSYLLSWCSRWHATS